ncbi:MAG: mannose-1-phosphate guanylyltransferase/mannose-6-phosphate isomerase [Rhizobiaceae bacterium]|nr:mannose-1-phosphate guanylyltransferase/mannose-6-phosphate isomerase [Rhizobiaceae bacterium]
MSVVPVVMCGGAGSRLWPLSRKGRPKPFIPLPDGETLIRKTYARAAALPDVGRIVTVTSRELMFLAVDEYQPAQSAGIAQSLILEPVGRDTAAAIALACLHLAEAEGEDAIALVLPADHLIADIEAFSLAVLAAAEIAASGRVTTFGFKPERPETGFGYVEADGTDLIRFVEKPNPEEARKFVESGRFFWNGGIFCFRVAVMLALMEEHCPDVLYRTRAAFKASRVSGSASRTTIEVDQREFAKVEPISIDHAVMEKLKRGACVPCDFTWADIGSLNALSKLTSPDGEGNRVIGDVVMKGTTDSFVHGADRLVCLVGVSDLLVLDTPEALLVCAREAAQDIKEVQSKLQIGGSEATRLHGTARRPWGSYTVLEESRNFKIKRIEVNPGGRLSLQSHRHRSEHWVVVSGQARVTIGGEVSILKANQSAYIPCGNIHRLENPAGDVLVLIEVQCGNYLGEDDIERFDDEYGRTNVQPAISVDDDASNLQQ